MSRFTFDNAQKIFDPDVQTDSKVFVNGARIPAGDVDVYVRNEGPLSITRYAEVYFYSPVFNIDWISNFKSSTPSEQNEWDTIRIELKDSLTETYNTVFYGVVTGLGNSSSGHEKEFLARARGPGHLINNIKANENFNNPTVGDILRYIENELEGKYPFKVGVGSDSINREVYYGTIRGLISAQDWSILTSKTFQPNRDTLQTAISWLEDRVNGTSMFIPTEEGASLIFSTDPSVQHHDAHYLDGNLGIINNNALNELLPINTLVMRGSAKRSLKQTNRWAINIPTKKYYTATVRHNPLYERSGHTEYSVTDKETDASSKTEVVNEAKNNLRKEINNATSGVMTALLRSPIKPFDTVRAKPTCQKSAATDTNAITYQVKRVHHKIRPTEISKTELNVGLNANTSQIELVTSESGWKEM